jgi:hypothetical protein
MQEFYPIPAYEKNDHDLYVGIRDSKATYVATRTKFANHVDSCPSRRIRDESIKE